MQIRRKIAQRTGIVAFLLLLSVIFQNCNGYSAKRPFGLSGATSIQADGNGSGYDGMVFAHADLAVNCPDGSHFVSAIGVDASENVLLIRKDCLTVEAQTLDASQYVMINAATVEYLDQSYVYNNSLATNPPPLPPGSISCIVSSVPTSPGKMTQVSVFGQNCVGSTCEAEVVVETQDTGSGLSSVVTSDVIPVTLSQGTGTPQWTLATGASGSAPFVNWTIDSDNSAAVSFDLQMSDGSSATQDGLTGFTCTQGPGWGVVTSSPPTVPTGLVLTQTPNHQDFTVSWKAGSGNGGAGGCKLQMQVLGGWADFNDGRTYNCDADTNQAAVNLPNGLGAPNLLHIAGWRSDGILVRMQRIADHSVMGVFRQKPTCSTLPPSLTPTPLIDEDCDGHWDNQENATCAQDLPSSALTFGAAYSCPSTTTCSGATASFDQVKFTLDVGLSKYSSSSCTDTPSDYSGSATDNSATGTVPHSLDGFQSKPDLTSTACQDTRSKSTRFKFAQPFSVWTGGQCEYTYSVYN